MTTLDLVLGQYNRLSVRQVTVITHCLPVLSCPGFHTYCLLSQASWLLTIDTGWVPFHERLCDAVSHTDLDIEEIIDSIDRKLFSQITQPRHCLHHLLPPKTSTHCPYSFWKRQHYYHSPHVEYSLYKNSFIIRCLFNFR